MTMQYAYVANQLPENKMRMYPTKVINIIGGPGCDKSLFTAAIILYLNLHNKTVEQIPDFAKSLVWQKDYEALKRTTGGCQAEKSNPANAWKMP